MPKELNWQPGELPLAAKSGAIEHLIREKSNRPFWNLLIILLRNVSISISIISDLLVLMNSNCSLKTGQGWSISPVISSKNANPSI